MRGRTIRESKIVVSSHFDYDDARLTSASVSYVSDFEEYQQQQADEVPQEKQQTRIESIFASAYKLYDFFSSKNSKTAFTQAQLIKETGLTQGTVSKALAELTSEPALLQKVKRSEASTLTSSTHSIWRMVRW